MDLSSDGRYTSSVLVYLIVVHLGPVLVIPHSSSIQDLFYCCACPPLRYGVPVFLAAKEVPMDYAHVKYSGPHHYDSHPEMELSEQAKGIINELGPSATVDRAIAHLHKKGIGTDDDQMLLRSLVDKWLTTKD